MTARAAFTAASLARAIKVAREAGAAEVVTPDGIRIILTPESAPTPPPAGGNTCDEAFGVTP